LENLDYDEPWLVVDMKVKDACLEKLPSTNVQYCDPARPSTLICCPGNHRRWEFMTLPSDSSDAVIQEDQLWDLMSPWIKPGEADIWRAASYRFHALVARKWQVGRVFLAGDSAHQTPPFLGQGMCQGIRDAGNLAWKLHHVVSGFAPESLLATYEEERRPNVLATTILAKECGLIISERNVEKAKIRDAEIYDATGGLGRMIIRQDLIPPFTTGFIDFATPLAGTVFPQPLVSIADGEDVLLDDLLSPQFHLILLATSLDECELNELCNAALNLDVKIVVVHGTRLSGRNNHPEVLDVYETTPLIQEYLTNNDCAGAIVRPDLYVYCGIVNTKNALGALAVLTNRLRALN